MASGWNETTARHVLQQHGQLHVLEFWDELTATERHQLLAQLVEVDYAGLTASWQTQANAAASADALDLSRAEPPPALRLPITTIDSSLATDEAITRTRRLGEQAMARGGLGFVLVAGGQGTRLGFPHPKGMFPCGPVSQRSLFQIYVDRLLALRRRYGVSIPLYLMTSPATHDETVEFFRRHRNFNYPESDVMIFCQGTMPSLDIVTGRLLLAEKHALALNPNGHGGTLEALQRYGCLEDMRARRVEHLWYFQVDNPLVPLGDPFFLGAHLQAQSEMTTQVGAKRDPAERVGNVIALDGRLHVVEYTELPETLAQQRDVDGSLRYWAGNLAVHLFERTFLERMSGRSDVLPYHLARKKVEYRNQRGERMVPEAPNAIKFEKFIFDLMPHAARPLVVEVDLQVAFAPIKNADGADRDTPQSAREAMVSLHRRWLEEAGAQLAPDILVEIDPQFAWDVTELAKKLPPATRVLRDTFFTLK